MRRLFVSRDLAPDSPIIAFAKEKHLDLSAFSLIEFSAIPFSTVPETDWIFFYSKNGVRFFYRRLQELGLKINAQVATIGTGTYEALKVFGKAADFAGNGQPETVAEAFGVLAAGKKVLFPRALYSRKSVQELIQEQVQVVDLVVYSNELKTNFHLERQDYLFFTSPKNVQAFLQKYPIEQDQQVIAIGNTTAAYLHKQGIRWVRTAAQPSEAAMLAALDTKAI